MFFYRDPIIFLWYVILCHVFPRFWGEGEVYTKTCMGKNISNIFEGTFVAG